MRRPKFGDVVRSTSGRHWYREERCGTDARRAVYAVRSVETGLVNTFRSDQLTFVTRSFWGDGLEAYFSVADEIDGGLTLDDLEGDSVAEARCYADDSGAPWPPDLAWAEDTMLARREAEWRRRNPDAYGR